MTRILNNLIQPRLPARSLEILNAVLFGATLIAALTGFVHHLPWWAAVLITVAFVCIYVIVSFSRYYSIYSFREDSAELSKFFTDWYKRQGDHTIFCDNLDWMDGPSNATVRAALIAHGEGVTVCLRRCSGPVFEELRTAGVQMRRIHDHVNMRAKISIKQDDGFGQMIVRIKSRNDNGDKVVFRRFSDYFSTTMAHELVINSSTSL
jgi:Ca2+/Na+ antiporter